MWILYFDEIFQLSYKAGGIFKENGSRFHRESYRDSVSLTKLAILIVFLNKIGG